MSGASGAGAPPPAGVVCNSALSFVASAQPLQPVENAEGNLQETNGEQIDQADRMVPAGLKALCDACSKLYPDQPNPLQVTTRLKYWLGGEDPLDYISMYWHPGKPEEKTPPHWHYVSFGLSDLHGDGRVHPSTSPCSGFGFELTFRLVSSPHLPSTPPAPPPLWPAALLQALARYVFATGNKVCPGDHITWHRPLERGGRLKHLLVAEDPALGSARTAHGPVTFLQIVGCTARELRAAQSGSGFAVLDLMREDTDCGGPYLVTDARRRRSARAARRARPAARAQLAGVSCGVRWVPLLRSTQVPLDTESPGEFPAGAERLIRDTLRRGLGAITADSQEEGQSVGHMSTDSFEMSSMERALPQISDTMSSWGSEENVQYFSAVHVFMNAEGASLLPLALDGRVRQGAHFTWREGASAVTLLAPSVAGALPTAAAPYAARGAWLQVLVSNELATELSTQVAKFASLCQSDSESEGEDSPPPPQLPSVVSIQGFTLTVL